MILTSNSECLVRCANRTKLQAKGYTNSIQFGSKLYIHTCKLPNKFCWLELKIMTHSSSFSLGYAWQSFTSSINQVLYNQRVFMMRYLVCIFSNYGSFSNVCNVAVPSNSHGPGRICPTANDYNIIPGEMVDCTKLLEMLLSLQ